MKSTIQPTQAQNNPLVTVIAVIATALAGATAAVFGLHALGASENKTKNRASGIFAYFERKTGSEENAKKIEQNQAVDNIITGAKIISNKATQCANTATMVISACAEYATKK